MISSLTAFGSTLRGFWVSDTVTPTNSMSWYAKNTIWKLSRKFIQPFGASWNPSVMFFRLTVAPETVPSTPSICVVG